MSPAWEVEQYRFSLPLLVLLDGSLSHATWETHSLWEDTVCVANAAELQSQTRRRSGVGIGVGALGARTSHMRIDKSGWADATKCSDELYEMEVTTLGAVCAKRAGGGGGA